MYTCKVCEWLRIFVITPPPSLVSPRSFTFTNLWFIWYHDVCWCHPNCWKLSFFLFFLTLLFRGTLSSLHCDRECNICDCDDATRKKGKMRQYKLTQQWDEETWKLIIFSLLQPSVVANAVTWFLNYEMWTLWTDDVFRHKWNILRMGSFSISEGMKTTSLYGIWATRPKMRYVKCSVPYNQ